MNKQKDNSFIFNHPPEYFRTDELYMPLNTPVEKMTEQQLKLGLCMINYGKLDRCRKCEHVCKYAEELMRRETQDSGNGKK